MKRLIKILDEVFWSLHPLIGAGIILSFIPIIAFILTILTVKLGFAYIVSGIIVSYLLFCWADFIISILRRLNRKDKDET